MRKIIMCQFLLFSVTLFTQEVNIEKNQLHQLALKQKNFYYGSIDGIIGQGTKKAISNFQRDSNLLITSELDEETLKMLMKDPRQPQIDDLKQALKNREEVVIHCFVALCCNQCQGIVPVPESLGKGDDPNGNLYWGAQGGLRTFFNKNQDWNRIKKYSVNDKILERLIYHRKMQNSDIYLVSDAYHGKYIDQTIDDFLQSSTGSNIIEIELDNKTIQAGGKSRLLAYVGHDGLMGFTYNKQLIKNSNARKRETIILACLSKSYFGSHIRQTGAYPLLWTSGLMAPEAYTLEAAIESWINSESSYEIRLRAAEAYNLYQNCGLDSAVSLLLSGW